jgi:hypothetical protein
VTILTILLKSWSIQKVQEVFPSASNFLRRAKQLVTDQGILSSPNPRPGKNLNKVTVEVVESFCNCDQTVDFDIRGQVWILNNETVFIKKYCIEVYVCFKLSPSK